MKRLLLAFLFHFFYLFMKKTCRNNSNEIIYWYRNLLYFSTIYPHIYGTLALVAGKTHTFCSRRSEKTTRANAFCFMYPFGLALRFDTYVRYYKSVDVDASLMKNNNIHSLNGPNVLVVYLCDLFRNEIKKKHTHANNKKSEYLPSTRKKASKKE